MIKVGEIFVCEKYNNAIAYTIATKESYINASLNMFLLNFAMSDHVGMNAIPHKMRKYLKSLAFVDR